MRASGERGFTLLELVLALSIVAAMLVILFGGLRVGLRSWQRGEQRAEALQHERSLAQLVERSLRGTSAYLGLLPNSTAGAGDPSQTAEPTGATGAQGGPAAGGLTGPSPATRRTGLLFEGEEHRISFVTTAPPFPLGTPIAFMAVTLSLESGLTPGLAIRAKVLPNTEPFEQGPALLVDPTVTAVSFRYLREQERVWENRWDVATEGQLPAAVEVTMTAMLNGLPRQLPPLTIPIQARTP